MGVGCGSGEWGAWQVGTNGGGSVWKRDGCTRGLGCCQLLPALLEGGCIVGPGTKGRDGSACIPAHHEILYYFSMHFASTLAVLPNLIVQHQRLAESRVAVQLQNESSTVSLSLSLSLLLAP